VRLKLGENVTVAAKDPLVALGHQVDTVADEDLTGRPDPDVLAAAIAEDRALVTCDLGFATPAPTRPRATAA
jgi:predicted nuclease of predicted toxin-antitoxin system